MLKAFCGILLPWSVRPSGFTAPKNKPVKKFATFFDFLRIYKQNRFFEEVIVWMTRG